MKHDEGRGREPGGPLLRISSTPQTRGVPGPDPAATPGSRNRTGPWYAGCPGAQNPECSLKEERGDSPGEPPLAAEYEDVRETMRLREEEEDEAKIPEGEEGGREEEEEY